LWKLDRLQALIDPVDISPHFRDSSKRYLLEWWL